MEEPSNTRIKDPREVLRSVGGRDELNLAEFPITLLSDRVPKEVKTIQFEVSAVDRATGKTVPRRLTITGSDRYGLANAVDDEILVGLIQLTKLKNNFTNQEVFFSRYELVEILGWQHGGRSYDRIEESIKRWTGVTLYYDNAWWDKETGTWKDDGFHIIDNCSLIARETRRVREAQGQHDLALSSFKWSDVIFRSFQAGSLKRLDVDAYFSFDTSVAKRMYRFLDKRFWVKDRWEFDLKEFAFEHIGLSRTYNVAQIKNKLQPAIEELSADVLGVRGAFLEPMEPDQRYVKIAKGQWLIIMARKTTPSMLVALSEPVPEPSGLEAELVKRGVLPEVAKELVEEFPPEQIALRIEVFDWAIESKNRKIIKESPTGYLVSSIKNRYVSLPKGFEPKAVRVEKEAAKQAERARLLEAERRKREREQREALEKAKIDAFWVGLSASEQAKLDEEALSAADPETLSTFEGMNKPSTNSIAQSLFRMSIRAPHIRRKLGLPREEPEVANA